MESSTQIQEYGRPASDHTADAERLAGLYAFGVLDGAELSCFERHLPGCGRCAEVVDGDRVAVLALSLTAPEVEPAPDLKARLLARAAAEAEAGPAQGGPATGGLAARGPAAGGPAGRPTRARRAAPSPLTWLLPLAAMVLALLAGAGLLSRELAGAQIVASAPLENRAGRGQAEVLVRRSGEGVIQLSGFEDLTDGRVYQAWVIRPGSSPQPTGATVSGDGTMTLDGDVRGTRVAVTLETGPGAQVPNRPPFLVGDVPA